MTDKPAKNWGKRIRLNNEGATVLNSERASAVRAELSAILKSSCFSGSKRCQDFLEFIVLQALEGNLEYLTERFLGAELFGRPINYETGTDSIVRVRASDVRRRLGQYYSEGHGGGRVTIELVSGSYIPEFHWLEQKAIPVASISSPAGPASSSIPTDESLATPQKPDTGVRKKLPFGWIVAGLFGAVAVGLCLGFWLKYRELNRSLYPLNDEPSMKALWSPFLDSGHQTDIVLSDASFQLFQDISKQSFSLDDYINRRYITQLQAKSLNAETQSILSLIASKDFGNSSEFRLAKRIWMLDRPGNRVQIYNSRDYSSSLVAQDNLALIGSQHTNPWQQLFQNQLNFTQTPPGVTQRVVLNKAPKPGESSTYYPTDSVGYCVVAYLPDPDHNTKVLLIEGSSSEATEAGGDFLLSEEKLGNFEKMLHAERLPFFEVLLKTSQVRGTPITATVEAYRTYSNPR